MNRARSAAILVAVAYLATPTEVDASCGPENNEARTTYGTLTWDDFRKDPPRWCSLCAGLDWRRPPRKEAEVSFSIRVEWDEIEISQERETWVARVKGLCARSVMHKDRSWYRTEWASDRLLAHEQAHFDLTEYFARQLSGRLRELTHRGENPAAASDGLRRLLHFEYELLAGVWRDMEARFDGETSHGIDRLKEDEWFERVTGLLEEGAPSFNSRRRQ